MAYRESYKVRAKVKWFLEYQGLTEAQNQRLCQFLKAAGQWRPMDDLALVKGYSAFSADIAGRRVRLHKFSGSDIDVTGRDAIMLIGLLKEFVEEHVATLKAWRCGVGDRLFKALSS